MTTKPDIEKLLVDCGHAINANNGKCPLIEDVLCRVSTLLAGVRPMPGLVEAIEEGTDYHTERRLRMLADDLGITRGEVIRRGIDVLNEARKATRGHEADRNEMAP